MYRQINSYMYMYLFLHLYVGLMKVCKKSCYFPHPQIICQSIFFFLKFFRSSKTGALDKSPVGPFVRLGPLSSYLHNIFQTSPVLTNVLSFLLKYVSFDLICKKCMFLFSRLYLIIILLKIYVLINL